MTTSISTRKQLYWRQ